MLLLKAILIVCGVVISLAGPSAPKDGEKCECNAVKERLRAAEKELILLTKKQREMDQQIQLLLQKEQGVKPAQSTESKTDSFEVKNESKRFLEEMDIEQEIINLKQTVGLLQQGTGSTYVRWRRTACPSTAEIVYKGYTGGNYYTHTGGPGNYLCLPDNPTWAKYVDGIQGVPTQIYGTEYEDDYSSSNNPFKQYIDDEDVPCVVCKTTKTANLMIPARTNCYDGWTLEYTGYLMAMGIVYNSSSEYICVDGQPEYTAHGHPNENGNLMYLVEGVCGSLPCGPYVNGRELACVVCTK